MVQGDRSIVRLVSYGSEGAALLEITQLLDLQQNNLEDKTVVTGLDFKSQIVRQEL